MSDKFHPTIAQLLSVILVYFVLVAILLYLIGLLFGGTPW